MRPLTREWVQKAEADLRAARVLHEAASAADQVCFLAQQCAEKYLKGVLQERDVRFAKIHDLEAVAVLIEPPLQGLGEIRQELRALTEMAVNTRYPGFFADAAAASRSIATATCVRAACRRELGLDAD